MTNLTLEDFKLLNALEDVKNTLTRLQLAFAKHPKSCACDGPLKMCPHHEAVFTQIDAARDRLLFAQAQLRRE